MYSLTKYRTYPGLKEKILEASLSAGGGSIDQMTPAMIARAGHPEFASWIVRALNTTPTRDQFGACCAALCRAMDGTSVKVPDFAPALGRVIDAFEDRGECNGVSIQASNIRRGCPSGKQKATFLYNAALTREVVTGPMGYRPEDAAKGLHKMVKNYIASGQDAAKVADALDLLVSSATPYAEGERPVRNADLWNAVTRRYDIARRNTELRNNLWAVVSCRDDKFDEIARIAKLPDDKFQSLITLLEVL